MKSKRFGAVLMAMGAVLLGAALLLLAYNAQENKQANEAAQQVLPEVQATIAQRQQAANAGGQEPMMAVPVAGTGYIGVLALPPLGLELPVLSEWSYDNLNIGPCRHFGATETDDLVIAGHDYTMHFGGLSALYVGAPLRFTDMNGGGHFYEVGTVEIIPGDAADYVKNSDWDLVLYTCTYSGRERVMVGAKRVSQEAYSKLQ